ncbi:MAG: TauD/TfdA family dioxygenase [Beijerinckiaceae bacterium]
MGFFGPRRTRAYAKPLQPLIDPAGWEPVDIERDHSWAYTFTQQDIAEITAAVENFRAAGKPLAQMRQEDFQLPRLGQVLADARQELLEGRGFVYLRGLPVETMGNDDAATAYFGIGCHVGEPVSQNAQGHILGHVKDYGRNIEDLNARGYQTTAELGFHADHSDYVGLLCLRTAKIGGASRFASSVTLYNRLLAMRPDLVKVLCEDFYYSRGGEIPPGKEPWYTQPAFSFVDGYFSARGLSSYVLKAQRLPGVPPFTDAQKEAIALFRKTVSDCAVNLDFRPGDIQLLHNHVVLHSRSAYQDWPEPNRKRHLLRLWLRDRDGRPLPESVRENFVGVEVEGTKHCAPLDLIPA